MSSSAAVPDELCHTIRILQKELSLVKGQSMVQVLNLIKNIENLSAEERNNTDYFRIAKLKGTLFLTQVQ